MMHDQTLALWREEISAALPESIMTEDMDTAPERVSRVDCIACVTLVNV